MAPPAVEPGPAGLFGQLSVLPSKVRIAAGLLMLGMGVAGMVMMPRSFWSLALLGFALLLGIPLLFGGIRSARQQRLDASERARAEAELPALRDAIAAAVAQSGAGSNIGRLLRERGYTSGKVRRWIGLECGIVLPDGDAHR